MRKVSKTAKPAAPVRFLSLFVVGGGAAIAIALASQSPARADDQSAVEYRQVVMKSLNAEATALGMIMSGQVPPDTLDLHTRSLANGAKAASLAFEAKIPGGSAKPQVWNSEDFRNRMKEFSLKTEQMAQAGATGDLTAVGQMMVSAMPCKACHDLYKEDDF